MASSLARPGSGLLRRSPSNGSCSHLAALAAAPPSPAAPPGSHRSHRRRAAAAAPAAALPRDGDIAVPAGGAPPASPRGKVAAHGSATVFAPTRARPAFDAAAFSALPFVTAPIHPELLEGLAAPPPLPAAAAPVPPPPVRRGAFDEAYEMGDLLGSGTFGDVRSATERATGRRAAVKVLPKRRGGRDARATVLQEAAFGLALQGSPITARLYGVYEDDTNMYLVQELCSGGDIASLQAVGGGRLEEREAAAVMLSVLRFLAHAHRSGVCYGDVKPNNFVLRRLYPCIDHMVDPAAPKGPLDVCAVDFGCVQRAEPDVCLPEMPVSGTPAYLSPEAFGDCFGMPSDVWAAGVMLYHLLSGGFPFWVGSADQFHGMTPAELRDGILRGSPMFMRDPWAGYSPRVKDLICKMLEKNPADRITAAAAASHLWFAEVLGDEAAAGGGAAAAVRASR
ncbi:MAG: kinase-like domain-containing protein [Monoraphidium minutum]|nr:MAG: kinase-like domain-containing protein [Monoraphidium minutum]